MSDGGDRLVMMDGDAALILRMDGSSHIVTSVRDDEGAAVMTEANLLAIGLKLCVEDDVWRKRVVEKTMVLVNENLDQMEREAKPI